MPVKHGWVNSSQQHYLVRVESPWMWDQLQHDLIFEQINGVAHSVVLIFDVKQAKGFPKGDILGRFKDIEKAGEAVTNISNITIIGAPYLAKTFTNVYQRLRHNTKQPPVIFADTVEEAINPTIKTT